MQQHQYVRNLAKAQKRTGLSGGEFAALIGTTKDNLKFLKRYFNKSGNVVSLIRNEAAFHYSRANVYEALNSVTGDRGCVTYLAGPRYHHELYEFCEMAMAAHLLDQTDADRKRAVVTVQQEIADVGTKLSHFLKDVLLIILQDAVAIYPKSVKMIISSLGLDRKKSSSPIPVFINPGDYYNEFTKLRRLLNF
jgi:hypothetical protein